MSRRISRRTFSKAGAASCLLTSWIRSSAQGDDKRLPPGDRMTIGLIGCGKMASDYHLPELLKQPDTQVVAVCDVDRTRRQDFLNRVNTHYSTAKHTSQSCQSYSDYREVLSRDDIDAICIATPDHWHATPLIEACKAGKDVYCEKPLTLTIAEAERCVQAARKYERIVQTGSQQRSNVFGPFREAVEFLQSGRLGKISRVTVGVGAASIPCDLPEEPLEPGLDWDLWLGQAPWRPYHSHLSPRGMHGHFPAWRSYREYSGGGHTDMGAHHYDIAQWALGMDGLGPVEIIPPAHETAEMGVVYRYENGVEVVHGGPSGCVFYGERGTLSIDRGQLQSDPEEIVKTPLADDEVHLPVSPGHHRNWLDCIRTRKRPIADVEIGARTVTLIHLGNLAYLHRMSLKWNPQTWRFVDPAHDAWRDRPRRDPWQLPQV
jgi:predicted dehydrogenase